MPDLMLEAKTTALVTIELQNNIIAAAVGPYTGTHMAERGALLARTFREKGAPVIEAHVQLPEFHFDLPVDQPLVLPYNPPPEDSAIAEISGKQDGDYVVAKRHFGAFAGTELETILEKHGITTVVVAGIATDMGVESTVRQGTGLGFGFVVTADACTALVPDEHYHSINKSLPLLARIRTSGEIIAALKRRPPLARTKL